MAKAFGAYQVEFSLGLGPLGKTYVVKEWLSRQFMVLKEIRCELEGNRNTLTHLREEVALARKFESPSLLTLHGMPEIQGDTVLIRSYCEGLSLEAFIHSLRETGHRISLSSGIYFCRRLVDAIAELHVYGPHGRLHARNVLLSSHGNVILSDPIVGNHWLRYRLDKKWVTLGEAEWLSPEILRGGKASVVSDLYALGILLDRMKDVFSEESHAFLGKMKEYCQSETIQARVPSLEVLREYLRDISSEYGPESGASGLEEALSRASTFIPTAIRAEGLSMREAQGIGSTSHVQVADPIRMGECPTLCSEVQPRSQQTMMVQGRGSLPRIYHVRRIFLVAFLFCLGVALGRIFPKTIRNGTDGLEIRSCPSGVEMVLYNSWKQRVFLGTTPVRCPKLAPGKYTLHMNKEGFLAYERSLEIVEDKPLPPMNVSMEVQLYVKPSPASTQVWIRGGPIEEWSQVEETRILMAGQYLLRAKATGFETWLAELDLSEKTASSRPGGVLNIPIELFKEVVFCVYPEEAILKIQDREENHLEHVRLPAGKSSLSIQHPLYDRMMFSLFLNETGQFLSENPWVTITEENILVRLSRSLDIVSRPPGARIVVMGDNSTILGEGISPLWIQGVRSGEMIRVQAYLPGHYNEDLFLDPDKVSLGEYLVSLSPKPLPSVSVQVKDAFSGAPVEEVRLIATTNGMHNVWNYPIQPRILPDTYNLSISAFQYQSASSEITVHWEPEIQTFDVLLEPWPEMMVRVLNEKHREIPESHIFLNAAAGNIPRTLLDSDSFCIPSGRYTIEVVAQGYQTEVVSFDLRPSRTIKIVEVYLQPALGVSIHLDAKESHFKVEIVDQVGKILALEKDTSSIEGLSHGMYDLVVTDLRTQATQRVRVQLGNENQHLHVKVDDNGVELLWPKSF